MRLAFSDGELAFQQEVRDWIAARLPITTEVTPCQLDRGAQRLSQKGERA